jgi:hypothetical protein
MPNGLHLGHGNGMHNKRPTAIDITDPSVNFDPTPAAGDRSYLSAAARAEADAIDAFFNAAWTVDGLGGDWMPDVDSITWDDTIVMPDGNTFHQWIRSGSGDGVGVFAVGGVVRNPNRSQRVLFVAAGDWTYAGSVGTSGTPGLFELRGGRPADFGKALLLEAQTTPVDITARFSLSGCRGVYFRNLNWIGGLDDWGTLARTGELAWEYFAPKALRNITITNPGAGYTVGDPINFAGTYDNAPVATVATVDGGGGITGINITYGGRYLANQSNVSLVTSVTAGGTGAGAVLAAVIWTVGGTNASPRDTPTIFIQRNTTAPNLPIVVFDNCKFGRGHNAVGDNFRKYAVTLSCINAEQLTVKSNCHFKGYQTGITAVSIRRFNWGGRFQRGIGDEAIHTHINAYTAVVGGPTWATAFPDLTVYEWKHNAHLDDLVDDNAAVNVRGDDLRMDQEHTDGGQNGTSADDSVDNGDPGNVAYRTLDEYNFMYGERETYQDRNSAFRNNSAYTTRVVGGTQYRYRDDSDPLVNINGVCHSNLVAVTGVTAEAIYNGTVYSERNTYVRVGRSAPPAVNADNGFGGFFSYDTDQPVNVSSRKNTAGAAATHTLDANIRTTTQALVTNVAFTETNAVNADPRLTAIVGERYSDVFPGAFITVNTLTGYNFTDDGTPTIAAQRAAFFAIFGRAEGAPDPATWPS